MILVKFGVFNDTNPSTYINNVLILHAYFNGDRDFLGWILVKNALILGHSHLITPKARIKVKTFLDTLTCLILPMDAIW